MCKNMISVTKTTLKRRNKYLNIEMRIEYQYVIGILTC